MKFLNLPDLVEIIDPLTADELRQQQFNADDVPNWLRRQIPLSPLVEGAIIEMCEGVERCWV